MNTPSTHCSTPQKSPSSADGMGDGKHTLTPEKVVLFKDQAGDLENAPTPPSPFTSSDTTTPDATAATSTQENRPSP